MGPGDLELALSHLNRNLGPALPHPDLLVGLKEADDVAVYKLSDDLAIIQTVDFFPPIVNVLFLTKPLGTGVIATAFKKGAAEEDHFRSAVENMLKLNKRASEIIREVGASVCTDVTGFGLLGHAFEVADRSGVNVTISAERIPLLPGALECARKGFITGGGPETGRF